jgi:hypothetical protein
VKGIGLITGERSGVVVLDVEKEGIKMQFLKDSAKATERGRRIKIKYTPLVESEGEFLKNEALPF